MKKIKLNIQLFAATASISNARQSVDVNNNREVQRITFTITRTSGTTHWDTNKTLTFTLKYLNNNDTKTTLTQNVNFSFPTSVTTKSAYVDFTVPHKDDGTQTIDYEASIVTGTSAGTLNPKRTGVSLTPIERQSLRIYINGEWKRATPYIRVNNEWKRATAYKRINNEWEKGV